ncbi:hypothetical protein D3C76_1551740 [compost metagenome]
MWAVGWDHKSTAKLNLEQTVAALRCARKDVLDRLEDAGIQYTHSVRGDRISCELTDMETGACMHAGVSNTFDREKLYELALLWQMEQVGLH